MPGTESCAPPPLDERARTPTHRCAFLGSASRHTWKRRCDPIVRLPAVSGRWVEVEPAIGGDPGIGSIKGVFRPQVALTQKQWHALVGLGLERGQQCRRGGKPGNKGGKGQGQPLAPTISKTSSASAALRRARVVSLLELHFTVAVADLYSYWNTLELLAVKRLHSRASVERTVAAWIRHEESGRWGWGQ